MKKKYNYCRPGARSGRDNIKYVHGMSNTRFYRIWKNIKTRCCNKNCVRYNDYGGRNIKCLWKSFVFFKKDMYKSYLYHVKKYGEKNTTIDRINIQGNYCKENCRWATIEEQSQNKRNNILITYKNKIYSLPYLSKKYNLNMKLIRIRKIKLKWSDDKAISTPLLNNSTRKKGYYY